MSSVSSPAAEFVARYRRASFLQRIGALMVDALLFFAFVAVPAWIISWIFGPGDMTNCEQVGSGGLDDCVVSADALRFTRAVFYGLWAVWVLVYARTITSGASVGKRTVEIMVIDATTGDTISYRRALVRTVLGVVSVALLGIGMLWALTNRDRRTAHDLVTGTRVISN